MLYAALLVVSSREYRLQLLLLLLLVLLILIMCIRVVLVALLSFRAGKSETRETARAAVSSALQTVFQDDAETISMRDNSTLSGGQKARVALAGALAKAYTLGGGTLLLDEVNAYLDFEESNRLLAFIRELVSADTEYNFSAILVTHREEDLKFADGFTFLRRGRILKTTTDYNQALRQFAKI